jgi:glycosyltransferase involved in cell wall biosynthesis
LRIVHVVPLISPKFGGPSVALTGLARCLTSHGVDTMLVTTDADPDGRLDVPLNRPVVQDGATYVFHHVLGIGGRYGFAPSIVKTLRRTVATYDLVHIHWLYGFVSIAAARAAIAAGVPFVVQPNGSLDPHLLRKNWQVKQIYLATVGRPLLTRAAAVVFTCEQERMLASYGARRPEWVIPVGLDGASFAHLPSRGTFRSAFPSIDGPFLLFVGRLSRQKGLDLLIGAFARLARERPDLWLVLAGPDPDGYGAHVRALSEQLGVADRVVFAGLLPHELKLAALIDAELFVLPSYAENFGAVITEALACGLPVVISDQVNIHRELAAAGAATVVACSVESVAAGVASALNDTAARALIATLGPALIHAHYTWDAIIPTLVARYADVIARMGRIATADPQPAVE